MSAWCPQVVASWPCSGGVVAWAAVAAVVGCTPHARAFPRHSELFQAGREPIIHTGAACPANRLPTTGKKMRGPAGTPRSGCVILHKTPPPSLEEQPSSSTCKPRWRRARASYSKGKKGLQTAQTVGMDAAQLLRAYRRHACSQDLKHSMKTLLTKPMGKLSAVPLLPRGNFGQHRTFRQQSIHPSKN